MDLFFYSLKFITNFPSRVNNQLVKNQESIEFKLYRERCPFERCCVLSTTFKFVILIEFSLNFVRTLYMNLSLMLSRIKFFFSATFYFIATLRTLLTKQNRHYLQYHQRYVTYATYYTMLP